MASPFSWPVLVPYAPSVLRRRLPLALGFMKAPFVIALQLIAAAQAATIELEALEPAKCLSWSISAPVDGSMPSAIFASKLIAAHPSSSTLLIYSATAHRAGFEPVEKIGACTNANQTLRCLPNQDFPLAGAKYEIRQKRSTSPYYLCVSKCDSAPKVLYSLMLNEGQANKQLARAQAKLKRKCHRPSNQPQGLIRMQSSATHRPDWALQGTPRAFARLL